MVRHYEAMGLLAVVARTDAGYRQYFEADVHTLQGIKRARELGFSMAGIAELAQRIEGMQAMQRTLGALLNHCHGDERPDCSILDDLAGTYCYYFNSCLRIYHEGYSHFLSCTQVP